MSKPEIVSKLALYLMDKEPLIYLFILNSDWHYDPNFKNISAVYIKDNRVQYIYNDDYLKLSLEEKYFVIIHEADHIFKGHLRIHNHLTDHDTANIAEDCIINSGILSMDWSNSFVPKMPPGWVIPEKFKDDNRLLGKDAYTTPRLYDWLKNKPELTKKEFLLRNKWAKIISTGEYCEVFFEESPNSNTFEVNVQPFEIIKKRALGEKNVYSQMDIRQNIHIDNLLPVVFGNANGDDTIAMNINFDVESHVQSDSHEELKDNNLSDKNDTVSNRIFSEKLLKQAEEMIKNNPALMKQAGKGNGDSFFSSISKLYKPKEDWKKVFKQYINVYISDTSNEKKERESYITWLRNPKSGKMIFKSKMKYTEKKSSYILLAVDTSGSCFGDSFDTKTFFTEIDSISKEMKYKKGKVFITQWDYSISKEFQEYNVGDWKNFKLYGGGGTNPRSVFDYIESITEENGIYSMKITNKDIIYFETLKQLPLLIVLTDGDFSFTLSKKQLGLYKDHSDKVIFVTKHDNYLFKEAKKVLYGKS